MKLKLTLQYHGGPFGGWQFQPAQGAPLKPSIQGTLAEALGALWGGIAVPPETIVTAGRTDAGVHALGQVCHLEDAKPLPLIKYLDGLNHYLPESVRITRVAWVEDDFHARYSATARHYIYKLINTRALSPHWTRLAGHIPTPLDVAAMQKALSHIPLGESDFSSFRDAECQSKTPLCTLLHHNLTQPEPGLILFTISGNHFLHHMVRNIMGTLVEVGLGRREPASLPALLHAKNRSLAGPTFSPAGLYLAHVTYPPHAEIDALGLDLSTPLL